MYMYIYIYIYIYVYTHLYDINIQCNSNNELIMTRLACPAAFSPLLRRAPRKRFAASLLAQSFTSKGIGRQGIGSFCKEILCFSAMPCRPTPLLVHF